MMTTLERESRLMSGGDLLLRMPVLLRGRCIKHLDSLLELRDERVLYSPTAATSITVARQQQYWDQPARQRGQGPGPG